MELDFNIRWVLIILAGIYGIPSILKFLRWLISFVSGMVAPSRTAKALGAISDHSKNNKSIDIIKVLNGFKKPNKQ